MILELTDTEQKVLISALRATVEQLDEIMENTPNREVADASNALEDILIKLGEGN